MKNFALYELETQFNEFLNVTESAKDSLKSYINDDRFTSFIAIALDRPTDKEGICKKFALAHLLNMIGTPIHSHFNRNNIICCLNSFIQDFFDSDFYLIKNITFDENSHMYNFNIIENDGMEKDEVIENNFNKVIDAIDSCTDFYMMNLHNLTHEEVMFICTLIDVYYESINHFFNQDN